MADARNHHFNRTVFSVLFVIGAVSSLPAREDFDNELKNPCMGRPTGFVRDLSSCQNYFQCDNGQPISGTCDTNYVFDAETEECVGAENADRACFRCPDNTNYELVSVPNICGQYIQCLNGSPELRACPSGMAFDGRAGVHQCNVAPSPYECYREDFGDIEHQSCPQVYDEPIYYVEPTEPTVYNINDPLRFNFNVCKLVVVLVLFQVLCLLRTDKAHTVRVPR